MEDLVRTIVVVGGAEGEFMSKELMNALYTANDIWGGNYNITTVVLDGVKLGLFAPEEKTWPLYCLVFSKEYLSNFEKVAQDAALKQLEKELEAIS